MIATLALTAAAAVALPSAPPPIAEGVRTPPPVFQPVVPAPRLAREEMMNRKASLDVDVRAGGQELWSGPMRLTGRAPASFSRQKSDAPVGDCPLVDGYSYRGVRSSLSVSLNMSAFEGRKEGFRLSISWERPGEASGCGGQDGTRTIGLTQSFNLEPGQEASFSGDGGLTVRLRRRD